MAAHVRAFLKPMKNWGNARAARERLLLILDLLGVVGVGGEGDGGEGFGVADVMAFVARGLGHASFEVRNAAVQITMEMGRHVGHRVLKFVPEDTNPKIIQ